MNEAIIFLTELVDGHIESKLYRFEYEGTARVQDRSWADASDPAVDEVVITMDNLVALEQLRTG
jgi:hypothetical protein